MLSLWRIPLKVHLPRVWGRFSDVYSTSGKEFELRVLDNEWRDTCLELVDVFIKDDPLLKALDLSSDPTSVASLKLLILQYLVQEIAVGCFLIKPGAPKLVAVDVIHVRTNNDRHCDVAHDSGAAYKRLLNILQSVNERVNIFKHYGVLKYLTSFGIITNREDRTELMMERFLETRKSISAALGIDVVASLFTNGDSSEKLAKRSKYKVLAEISSEDVQDDDSLNEKRDTFDLKVAGLSLN